jgi:TonB family protein
LRRRSGRDDISWGLWLGFLVAACLAHAIVIVPSGNAILRSFTGFEAKPKAETVLNLDLMDLDDAEPEEFIDDADANDEPSDSSRVAQRNSKVDDETQAPTSRVKSTPTAAKPGRLGDPGSSASESSDEPAAASDDLVSAADGTESDAPPTPSKIGNLGKLGGSRGALDDMYGRPSQPEKLPDVKQGRENMLDSKEHLFSSFFTRMRGRVLEHWNVQAAINRNDPQGKQIGGIPRTTVVLVQVSRDGGVERVTVQRTSGVGYLDAEATRALKAASPFPNPPPGLFGDADSFTITVAFTVEPDGSSRFFRR